jgi:hypothetical protein
MMKKCFDKHGFDYLKDDKRNLLPRVPITLRNPDGPPVVTTTVTDENGFYELIRFIEETNLPTSPLDVGNYNHCDVLIETKPI